MDLLPAPPHPAQPAASAIAIYSVAGGQGGRESAGPTQEPWVLDRFCNVHEVRRLTSLCKTLIYAKIKDGSFPAPYPIATDARGRPSRVAWSLRDIIAWQRGVREKAMAA